MKLLPIFTAALLVAFSGAIMPGPLLTITIEKSATKGWKSALLLIVGHAFLEALLVIGLCFGFAAVLNNHLVIRAIGIFGGLFLLWMGYSMMVDVYRGRISLIVDSEPRENGFRPILQGITTSISNPYWTLWWATIGASFVLSAFNGGVLSLTSFYFGHISGDFIWYFIIAFIVSTGRRIISDRLYRGIIFSCGVFLVALALTFIFNVKLF